MKMLSQELLDTFVYTEIEWLQSISAIWRNENNVYVMVIDCLKQFRCTLPTKVVKTRSLQKSQIFRFSETYRKTIISITVTWLFNLTSEWHCKLCQTLQGSHSLADTETFCFHRFIGASNVLPSQVQVTFCYLHLLDITKPIIKQITLF